MKKVTIPLIAAVVFTMAQFGAASAQMMRPQFGPNQQKLSFLLGRYKTESQMTMGGNSSTRSGYQTGRYGLDSLYVFISSSESGSAMGSFRSFGVLGYNSRSSEYELSMFNTFGFNMQYKGNFSGDTLIMSGSLETQNGTFKQRIKWFKEGNNLRYLMYGDFGGNGYQLMVDETGKPVAGGGMREK